MKVNKYLFVVLAVFGLILSACSATPASNVEETASTEVVAQVESVVEEPTDVPATETALPEPTATSEPTDEPEPTEAPEPTEVRLPFELVTAWTEGDTIPVEFSCDGANTNPEIQWGAAPEGTQSLVVIFDDPDAVPVAGFVWDHWLVFNLPGESTGLAADVEFADGVLAGTNSFGSLAYGGPCPPPGQGPHVYSLRVLALDVLLDLPEGALKSEILVASEDHILETLEITGSFEH